MTWLAAPVILLRLGGGRLLGWGTLARSGGWLRGIRRGLFDPLSWCGLFGRLGVVDDNLLGRLGRGRGLAVFRAALRRVISASFEDARLSMRSASCFRADSKPVRSFDID